MRKILATCLLTLCGSVLTLASASEIEEHYVLRLKGGNAQAFCAQEGLTLIRGLGAPNVYLVHAPWGLNLDELKAHPSVATIEKQLKGLTTEHQAAHQLNQSTAAILDDLQDKTMVTFDSSNGKAWRRYVTQPAVNILRLGEIPEEGKDIIAIIDTGIDPDHPVLKPALVNGYDFTRNVEGPASEMPDLTQSTAAILDNDTTPIVVNSVPVKLNQSTAAILDSGDAAVLSASQVPPAFGHGTMVAGLVRLVAPTAKIMPLKAFRADGTTTTSDVVRAIYYAVEKGARVINMSFSMTEFSDEIMKALNYATRKGVICVASAGNNAQEKLVYPAALANILSVASSTDNDLRSSFSNYGGDLVKLAAPGENLITTYPGGRYAMVSGTSFSTALVSGGVSLLIEEDAEVDYYGALQSLGHAKQIDETLGYGRVDMVEALKFWKKAKSW
jgi:hypothetical protein